MSPAIDTHDPTTYRLHVICTVIAIESVSYFSHKKEASSVIEEAS